MGNARRGQALIWTLSLLMTHDSLLTYWVSVSFSESMGQQHVAAWRQMGAFVHSVLNIFIISVLDSLHWKVPTGCLRKRRAEEVEVARDSYVLTVPGANIAVVLHLPDAVTL